MKKRILSILLTLCMVLCLVPTGVFAEGEATGSAAIRYGTDAIHGYDATDGYSYIYYGVHNGDPVKWRVLDTKTNTGEANALFLLTDECMGNYANGYMQFNPADKADRYLWKGSNAQTWCGNFYNTAFTAAERVLIPAVTQANSEYLHREAGTPSYYPAFKYQTGALEAEYVFAPSIQEINNANYGFATGKSRMAGPIDSTSAGTRYWLRSYSEDLPRYIGEWANLVGDQIGDLAAVRPAMNLSTDGNNNYVLFTSAAVGGKPSGGLQPVSQNYTGNEWKLTLYDSMRNDFIRTTWAVYATTKGGTVEISYAGAKTGENEYISALIFDDVSNVIYYGRSNAPLTEEYGTAQLTIPAGFAAGTYTMKVFNEQYNGDCKTDLASGFADVTLTVKKQADEQFTLTPGSRYYFDLSAMDIPGTANSNLPDSTLHYVPFTYAGTVDAYVLKSASNHVADSSRQASVTTDKDAQYGYTYEHSLFIADDKVTADISWVDLNNAGFIFGKAYTAGGISYTLRAPTMGGLGNDMNGNVGDPDNNEWDQIHVKDPGFIKVSTGNVWGQDTAMGSSGGNAKVYRDQNNTWGMLTESNPNYNVCYRPVLELPTDLAADSLKIVELHTGEFMPGEQQNLINIIVKNGESFKAPAAEGLPRPDGISADAPLWWEDENGNYYKPGDTVPANVSALYALWGGFGLLLDRGDGTVEVTPDNYTDIFGDGTASFVLPQGKSYGEIAESSHSTEADMLEMLATGKFEGNVFPHLKLKNANLTSVTLSEGYIGKGSPFFITPDGKNTIGSLNGMNRSLSALSILGDGALTTNITSSLSIYAQYGGSSVTVTDGLKIADALCIDSGSFTVTDDTQAITLPSKFPVAMYIDDSVRLFLGSSAQDAAEADLSQLSTELEKWDDTLALFSGKTYVRIANAWDVTYQPGTDGTGDAVTDIKFYNDALTLKGKLFTRTGYTQVGWTTTDGGEKIYGLDAVYTQNEALTLYPVWKDSEKPTGEIKVGEGGGLFFKDTQTVTITAEDNSGADVEIAYLLSAEELTDAELANATFMAYTAPFAIAPDNVYIIYAKLTDAADNVAYIRSDRIVLDKTAPVIGGIEDGKIYCAPQTVTVTEEYVGTVTVNDEKVELDENGSFVLFAADGAQTIVVTDKAGNTAKMTVTVNDGHTFGEWRSNGDGTHTRTCTVDDCDGAETAACSGGNATCTEKAVCEVCGESYGELDANHHADLKHVDAKAATADAEGNCAYWYCDACGKYFADAAATREITKKDTVTAKLPQPAKTGDRFSPLWWLFLLAGGSIGAFLTGKKKKRTA